MKKFINSLILCGIICSISSCGSYQKICIAGKPDTKIYLPHNKDNYDSRIIEKFIDGPKLLGTISNDGNIKIKVPREKHEFLLVKDPTTGRLYPIGLDYKYKENATLYSIATALTLCWYPIFDLGYGGSDQRWSGWVFCKQQNINQDFPDAPYSNLGPKREVNNSYSSASKESSNEESSSISSSLLLKNYANLLEGLYIGSGNLKQNDITIETFNNMKILMTPVDRNTISVEILLNDDNAIFAPCYYNIKILGSNNFDLISEENDSVKIEIKGNVATYHNPNVKIDGETYSLQITTKKQN